MKYQNKKYRLRYNENKKILNDYTKDCTGTITAMPNHLGSYESDNLQDIEKKIKELNLIKPENDEMI